MQGSPGKAIDYFFTGARLVLQPGMRKFILIPLMVNILIFFLVTAYLWNVFGDVFAQILEWSPNWLDWFAWLLWPLVAFIFLIVYGYSFNIITNFLAAPFFGLLAEKIEAQLTGIAPPDEPWSQLIPRTLQREAVKLWYFVSRGALVLIIFLILFFIPGANLLGAFIAAIWSCWCMAVQYSDYPADNHQLSFRELRRRLNTKPLTSYSYGGIILLGSMIPVLNIFVTPIAVAGATVYWIKEIKHPSI
ncbi:sulfate transporter CysZ [Cellvibrio sp. pealriver]|uniref:sulfate transporter CysZ n=1 Tax=Cellvibrio sp. pealriver TaxID=1622269 RepID=UPI00066FC8F2|nr:sulfate transporter CysZ [Cellvibrio sp. pealriver]